MANDNEPVASPTDELDEQEELETPEGEELTEREKTLQEKNRQLFARAKKAEGFELKGGKWVKRAERPAAPPKPADERPVPEVNKTGELDRADKAYLAATIGIKGAEEWALVREYISNGKSIDDLQDNRHFQNDLKDLRDAKETKAATPSSTRRSGQGASSDFDRAYAEYEQSGKLPDDFDLRTKVIETKKQKESPNTPPWRK